jgi:hypothetical protein
MIDYSYAILSVISHIRGNSKINLKNYLFIFENRPVKVISNLPIGHLLNNINLVRVKRELSKVLIVLEDNEKLDRPFDLRNKPADIKSSRTLIGFCLEFGSAWRVQGEDSA